MFKIEVEFVNLEKLVSLSERAIAEMPARVRRWVLTTAEMYKQAARTWAPVGQYFDRQGKPTYSLLHLPLRESIHRGPLTTLPDGAQVEVLMAHHGKFTLEPVKPHPITPRRKSRLAFYWVNAPPEAAVKWSRGPVVGRGVWVVVPGVFHPGYRPRIRWDVKAWEAIAPAVEEHLRRLGADVLLGAARA